jgi:hypothetical protein
MKIKQTKIPNYYIVLNGISTVARFSISENRYNGIPEINWDFGEDEVPIEIISEASQIEYMEV